MGGAETGGREDNWDLLAASLVLASVRDCLQGNKMESNREECWMFSSDLHMGTWACDQYTPHTQTCTIYVCATGIHAEWQVDNVPSHSFQPPLKPIAGIFNM